MTEVPVASLRRVCVIGAGTSGLVAAKSLKDRGIEFECFDESDRVGGPWVFKNENGRGGAYRSLHINTSRDRMQFRDYPMPRDYPDYPRHELIAPAHALLALLPYTNQRSRAPLGDVIRVLAPLAKRVPIFDLGRGPLDRMVAAVEELAGLAVPT